MPRVHGPNVHSRLRPIDGTNRTSSSKFGGGGSWYGGGGYGGEYIPGVARRELKPHEQEFLSRGFLFQAPVFQYGGFEVIELTQVRGGPGTQGRGGLASVPCTVQAAGGACLMVVCHRMRMRAFALSIRALIKLVLCGPHLARGDLVAALL